MHKEQQSKNDKIKKNPKSEYFQIALSQANEIIERIEKLKKSRRGFSNFEYHEIIECTTAGKAAILRIAGDDSVYAKEIEESYERLLKRSTRSVPRFDEWKRVPPIYGILKPLKSAIDGGYLDSYKERIHASIFTDFLEMAEYLLEEGFKDAAAVIIGGVLEEHLRKLCIKNNISIEFIDSKKRERAKKASKMNDDLSKNVITKTQQKTITGWLSLRNNAAHGKYDEYSQREVELMLSSVTDFMSRFPA